MKDGKWSERCSVAGCLDHNIKIPAAIAQFNSESGSRFDPESRRDWAVFFLGANGGSFVQTIPCGCEIRGGGSCPSPIHIHYCEMHAEGEAGQPTGETVDITPESLKTAEGRGKVATAVDEWEATHAEVANLATTFINAYGDLIARALREDEGQGIADMDELREAMADRAKKQEAFLVALAGR